MFTTDDVLHGHLFWLSLIALTILDWLPNLLGDSWFIVGSQMLRLAMMVLWAIYLVMNHNPQQRIKFALEFPLLFMLVIITLYAPFDRDPVGNLYRAGRIIYWILGVLVIYRLTYRGVLSQRSLLRYVNLAVLAAIVLSCIYFVYYESSTQKYNADAYWLLLLLPFVMLGVKKSRITRLMMILAIVGICITVKRGAIVALALSLVGYVLAAYVTGRKFILNLKLLMLVLVSMSGVYIWQADRVKDRFAIEKIVDPEKGASGRYALWGRIYAKWANEDNVINRVLGYGSQGVSNLSEMESNATRRTFAHSDIVELCYDYGVMGIMILFMIHSVLIRTLMISYRMKHEYFPSLVMTYIILLGANIYSILLIEPPALLLFAGYAYMEVSVKKDALVVLSNDVVPGQALPHTIERYAG